MHGRALPAHCTFMDPPVHALKANALLTGLPEGDLAAVLALCERHSVPARAVLFAEDARCHTLHLLVSGTVKLVRRAGKARERVVEFVEAGEPLGEAVLIGARRHRLSAMALEPAEVIAIRAAPFIDLLHARPSLGWPVMTRVGARLARRSERFERLSTQSAEQRVAGYLLERARWQAHGRCVVMLPRRRIDLASLLGITPETLCRIVGRFERGGWIACCRERVTIVDARRLRSLL